MYKLRAGVDPIQTKIAQEAVFDDFAAGRALFPEVPVAKKTGTVPDFGGGGFALPSTLRAPNANYPELLPSVKFEKFVLDTHGIIAKVDGDELKAAQEVGLDVIGPETRKAQGVVAWNIDRQRAAIACNSANYPAGNVFVNADPAQTWTKANKATAIPRQLVAPMKSVIRRAGKRQNVMVIPADKYDALLENDDVLQYAAQTRLDPNDDNLLARYFGIERVYSANTEDENGYNYWTAVIVAYVPENPNSQHDVSFGYTLRQAGFPVVESKGRPDFEDEAVKNKVKDVVTPFMTGGKFGAILTGV